MAKDGALKLRGRVILALPQAKFKVKLENEMEVVCTLSGKLRISKITIIVDDEVDVELSPYDLTKGRICWRFK